MKILAVDTATTSCSVAVIDEKSLIAEMTIVKKETHSLHLMNMINTVIGFSGLKISDLDGFAVTKGPGSFTGLRIGISTIKGFAAATGKPMVGVSTLETLAMQASLYPYLICPLLDARKDEVYFSRYRFQSGCLKKLAQEKVASPKKAIYDLNEMCTFVGTGAVLYKKMISDIMGESAFFAPVAQNTIRASTIGHLCMTRFENKDKDNTDMVVPNYIRKSDAELKFKRRTKFIDNM